MIPGPRELFQEKLYHKLKSKKGEPRVKAREISHRFTVDMSQPRNLPDALLQFSEAIEKMNKTILVPRRLMDLPEVNLPTLPLKHHVCTDTSQRKNGELLENGEESVEGLFGVYRMLQSMKDEVVTGRPTEVEGCFRYHMQAVLETLRHLTMVARDVTNHYCEISGDPTTCLSLSKTDSHLDYILPQRIRSTSFKDTDREDSEVRKPRKMNSTGTLLNRP